ncbi:cell division protein ZapE [Motilibacter rhizosphaerae]|uniref:Cell division protein ZapE n=1 Tax=Motilibacter rhizosphaerae TaxID=598652 RepID=A0A4Q7NSX7_9ACTN|nr:cell division protein ZapE [Motilibacter rhizosphaerae]RZS89482.1 cell division protein ZapE [Motilibacter rhizosphaerae]
MPAADLPRLADRQPQVAPDRLVAELVPPPHFTGVSFATYRPDPAQPSQTAALHALEAFAGRVGRPGAKRGLFRRGKEAAAARGVYLDGGFGVGKTHLLASLWHAAPGPKVFGTFVEYTNLVGALGFSGTVEALQGSTLVCIDEFELDDPGDTVLVSTLLARLAEAGVQLAATSNTLPEALGEGRFAAQDFMREIQGLAARFDSVRIDGEDYRHRGVPTAPPPLTDEQVAASAAATPGATLDEFPDLLAHLSRVHPSRYGALLDGVRTVHLRGVAPVEDQSAALRLVVLSDRLYDRDIPVRASGIPLDQLFPPALLAGGYRKKYLRTLSRLTALATA